MVNINIKFSDYVINVIVAELRIIGMQVICVKFNLNLYLIHKSLTLDVYHTYIFYILF